MRARISRFTAMAITLAAALAAACGGGRVDSDSRVAGSSGASEEALARAGAERPSSPTMPQRMLCSGSPESISGRVVSVGGGGGLTIDTGTASETVYGLGPCWYWSENGIARPMVGDPVVASVSHVVTMDERVLLAVAVDGRSLALRDPSTCTPLW